MCLFLFVSVNYGSKFTIRCSDFQFCFVIQIIFLKLQTFSEVAVGFSILSGSCFKEKLLNNCYQVEL